VDRGGDSFRAVAASRDISAMHHLDLGKARPLRA
jgi:hypothetical protein